MRRVAVMGMAGAGKSTLAVALGRAIGAPVHHLDALYWKPGWVASTHDELDQAVRDLIAGESWVIDGNYRMAALAERLARADTVVVMLVPRRLAMWRVARRSLRHRGRTRPDLGEGNPERLSLEFLRWVWSWKRNHPDFVASLRADAVVVMLVPRRLAIWRVVRRSLRHRGRTRPDLGDDNPERLNLEFLRWVWNWKRNHPDFVASLRARAAGTPVLVVRNRQEAERVLDGAKAPGSSRGETGLRARR